MWQAVTSTETAPIAAWVNQKDQAALRKETWEMEMSFLSSRRRAEAMRGAGAAVLAVTTEGVLEIVEVDVAWEPVFVYELGVGAQDLRLEVVDRGSDSETIVAAQDLRLVCGPADGPQQ
eukprot:7934186-Heterocapsa_arctica.AAC.1